MSLVDRLGAPLLHWRPRAAIDEREYDDQLAMVNTTDPLALETDASAPLRSGERGGRRAPA